VTAWVLALVAGIALGSDDRERILTETQEAIRLEGEWEGTWEEKSYNQRRCRPFRLGGGRMYFDDGNPVGPPIFINLTDEGLGNCRVRLFLGKNGKEFDGIYIRESGRLIICFGGRSRPKKFMISEGMLLTLYPIKPRKK